MLSVITPTHDPKHLRETCDSLFAQTYADWEWVIAVNGKASIAEVYRALGNRHVGEKRIRFVSIPSSTSIGAIKRAAFAAGKGDVLVELDHDDQLTTDALAQLAEAFADQAVDFAYSNHTDDCGGGNFQYYPNWERYGWRYRTTQVDGRAVVECVSFEPTAASISLIAYAPNHVRAWRRRFYQSIGGHDPNMSICDDHELLIRTYLHGRMKRIDRCLYIYRFGQQNNTFSGRIAEIERRTNELRTKHLEALVLREGQLRGKSCYDLGGSFGCPAGWVSVDREKPYEVYADLSRRWPFDDSSVHAFRAHDIIEHVADKQHFMSELHRCLMPGGWALISVPSTDGRGAFQDPTHVSFWNENSFWYWTRTNIAAFNRNRDKLFMGRTFTWEPSDWHKANKIPYAVAELQAYKGDMIGIPGGRP